MTNEGSLKTGRGTGVELRRVVVTTVRGRWDRVLSTRVVVDLSSSRRQLSGTESVGTYGSSPFFSSFRSLTGLSRWEVGLTPLGVRVLMIL